MGGMNRFLQGVNSSPPAIKCALNEYFWLHPLREETHKPIQQCGEVV